MTGLLFLIPISTFLGLLGLAAFLWTLRSGQYQDLEGDAARILFDDEEEREAAADVAPKPEQTAAQSETAAKGDEVRARSDGVAVDKSDA